MATFRYFDDSQNNRPPFDVNDISSNIEMI